MVLSTSQPVYQALLDDLYVIAGVQNYETLKRYVATGRHIEMRLQMNRPVALIGNLVGTKYIYKSVKFPLHEWIRAAGVISKDFKTPLEAMERELE